VAIWVVDDREVLDRAAADLAQMFTDAETRLVRMTALQVRAGMVANPDNVLRALNLGELRGATQGIVSALQTATPAQSREIMRTAAQHGGAAALREMSLLASVRDVTAILTPHGAMAAQLLTLDLTSTLADVTRRILRYPDDLYRRAVGQASTDVLLGLGATNRTAQARAWQQLVSQGVTGFVDKAGRRWNLGTYVEMATRTATRRAWNDQHVQTMTDYGMDLVSIIVGSDACEACAAWAGKVLRTSGGPTGRITIGRADGPGTVTVDVAGTLDGARAAGWGHPNCRCRPVTYLPGLSIPVDATTYDPQAEADREHLRDLEVQVRKAKLDGAAALTDQQSTAAGSQVRGLQTQIREHIDTTGLNRKRYREQISLGRRVSVDGHTV
jgi:hypothetical protein